MSENYMLSELQRLKVENAALREHEQQLEYAYNEVLHSSFWRITWPMRYFISKVRKSSSELVERMSRYLTRPVKSTYICPQGDEFVLNEVSQIALTESISIAVHLHLYYEDLLPEFVRFLSNIPLPFDLYVSCRIGANKAKIRRGCKK